MTVDEYTEARDPRKMVQRLTAEARCSGKDKKYRNKSHLMVNF